MHMATLTYWVCQFIKIDLVLTSDWYKHAKYMFDGLATMALHVQLLLLHFASLSEMLIGSITHLNIH